MAVVTEIEMIRDGGTIEFRVSGSDADGFYRLQTPLRGTPQPLFMDGERLDFGSREEVALLAVLREWLAGVCTEDVFAAMNELDRLQIWPNLPARLSEVVPLYRVRTVVQRLSERCTLPPE